MRALGVLLAAAAALAAAAPASKPRPEMSWLPQFDAAKLDWKPADRSFAPGAEVAMLGGDPRQGGLFSIRVKLPAGARLAPHKHPGVERITVLSGSILIGEGAAPDKPGKQPLPVSRPNFIELCAKLTAEDEKAFEHLWRHLGLSVDWSMTYATIDRRSQRISQLSFLRLLARGEAYQLEAPTLWDVDFRTAVAQAELEDREQPGAYHKIRFRRADGGGGVEIDTTRPELIPACVAIVAHPDDPRYRPLFGSDSTASESIRVAPSVRVVSRSGVAPVTTISSVAAATVRTMSRLIV